LPAAARKQQKEQHDMKAARIVRKGFTLIEVLLVVAILVMLAGAVIFAVGRTPEKTRIELTRTMVEDICNQLERYRLDIGHFPTEEEGGIQALRVKPNFTEEALNEKWAGPYLSKDPLDPWGTKLNYRATDPTSDEAKMLPFRVWSDGPNKTDDNGENDDIKNKAWEQAAATP